MAVKKNNKQMELKGKKILFVCPKFFGYEKHIIAEIEAMGAEVSFLKDRLFDSPLQAALTRLFPSIATLLASKFIVRMLDAMPNNSQFDLLFVINGQTLSKIFLNRFKVLNPNAQSILYIWDSLKNRTTLQGKFAYFDSIFTFDPADAKKYHLHFRPLFFVNNLKVTNRLVSNARDCQLMFVGTMHSDRFKVIRAFKTIVPAHVKTFIYPFIQARWVYWVYKIFKKEYRDTKRVDFKFKPISEALLYEVYSRSSIILDIEHPLQQGLTMRTLDSLGAGKKLITTNNNIRDYEFYNTNNIAIINRHDAEHLIDSKFWTSPYHKPDECIYLRYTLRGWVREVLSLQ
jgi:hypothetical protein